MSAARVSLVTLGVADVARAVAFYEALGWTKAPQSVESTAFMIGASIVLGLWNRDEMIADGGEGELPVGSGSVALAVNFASVDAVSEAYDRALAAGALPVKPPAEVFWGGFSGNFRDLDGHLWEYAHNPFFKLSDDGHLDLLASDE
ncbi:putative glyoxalase/bleomycin resistance protein, dioxygenase superfamily [Aurantimonas manganoxydans SI85-9A1]|uniref:Putative glyoxalase/bleomycin resistance protein, dioxygenase superfamily n=2 Tax=Aurantimonas manganoxydans TaxID=651183 RepID=Q1YHP0_AURMS|nr:VOC family protein [Aurantimonas manganoxydans]EAS49539.1 putative glyoxalase/bleomycin resistance protein, dioxygenase superfamily [Aurantimonas manganoxydans SI85-9A1]BAT29120.1 putative glyoxalase/bleomycin resistance protein, dioxygenase superfamily [Aurantimonas manganoxydans SI85-9A1]